MHFLSLSDCLGLEPVDRRYFAHYVAIRDGMGDSTEEDLANIAISFLTAGGGVTTTTDYTVSAQSSPDNTVKVSTGRAYVPTSDNTMVYATLLDADDSVTIAANSSGDDQTDTIVLYIDLSATPTDDADNVAKLADVRGTSGAAPTNSEILTAIGSSNPYIKLAEIAVANGFTSINNANITDKRDNASFKTGSSVPVETYEDFTDQASDPQDPAADTTRVFTKDGGIYALGASGNAAQIGSNTVKANGSLGATPTIDWSQGNTQTGTLSANATFAFSNPTPGAHLTLILSQDSTGSRTISWPTSVIWPNDTAPTLTTTASDTDLVGFIYTDDVYYGFTSLNYSTS